MESTNIFFTRFSFRTELNLQIFDRHQYKAQSCLKSVVNFGKSKSIRSCGQAGSEDPCNDRDDAAPRPHGDHGQPRTMTEPLIRNISDTALWVAMYRAWETERPDPVFRDPYARRLAGTRGEEIMS